MIRDKLPRAPTKKLVPTGFPGEVTVRGLMLNEVMAIEGGEQPGQALIAAIVTDEDGAPVGSVDEWGHWGIRFPLAIAEILVAARELTPGVEAAKKD